MPDLIVTADDYGYAPRYDEGIAEAAAASAIDAVSAMVTRGEVDPGPLAETAVAVGLHLELDRMGLVEQVQAFEAAFGRAPDHLDGHHHCHARGRPAVEVADLARERGFAVRSADERHRRLLRCKGVQTQDRLVGRFFDAAPPVPPEVETVVRGDGTWGRGVEVVEWMTHPGRPGGEVGSDYDAGRKEDLRILLELAENPALRAIRTNWRVISDMRQ